MMISSGKRYYPIEPSPFTDPYLKKQKIDDAVSRDDVICTANHLYAQVQSANDAGKINKSMKDIYACGLHSKKIKAQLATYEASLQNHNIPFGLVLKKLNTIGLSLFLSANANALHPGDFLGFYSGPATYEKNPAVRATPADPTPFLYEAEISKNPKKKKIYSINPEPEHDGNYTKYINHSCLEPNVTFDLCQLAKSPNVLTPKLQIRVKVINKIEPGEMILINYGDDYWANMPFAPVFLTKKSFALDTNDNVIENNFLPADKLEMQQELVNWRTTLASCPIDTAIPEINEIRKIKGVTRLDRQQKKNMGLISKQVQEAGITHNLILNAFGADLSRRGIFLRRSASPIQKGDLVGVFGGDMELINPDQKAPLLSYFLGRAGGKDIIVNATESGNFTRFFNVAQKGHENVKAYLIAFPYAEEYLTDQEINLPDQLQAVFFAEKDINPGEQLLVEPNENNELNPHNPMRPAQITSIW